MSPYAKSLLAALLLTGPILAGATGMAAAQMRPPMGITAGNFDPAQLPEFKGRVAQYTLSPRGEVDGLILADGTEVQVSPRLSTALVFSVKPGDAVSIRGLKARAVAMVTAVTITNDASGAVVGDGETGGEAGMHPWEMPKIETAGKIKALLHTPHGDVNGVLLEDGTTARMPPQAAKKLSTLLVVGQTVALRGFGVTSPLGKSVGVMEIGPSADKLTKIDMEHMHHEMHGPHDGMGMMDGHMGTGHPGDGHPGAPPAAPAHP